MTWCFDPDKIWWKLLKINLHLRETERKCLRSSPQRRRQMSGHPGLPVQWHVDTVRRREPSPVATPALWLSPQSVTWSLVLVSVLLMFCFLSWFVIYSSRSTLLFVGDVNTVVEPFPFEMENGTEPFGTGEFLKWIFFFFYWKPFRLYTPPS